MTIRLKNKQGGMVLVISLLLLLVITLVGMATLGSTRVGEAMVGNMQAKHVVFQAADTSIEEAVDNTTFLWDAYEKGIDPATPEVLQVTTEIYASFSQDDEGKPVPRQFSKKEVAAAYQGATVPVGENATSLRMGASAYQLYHYRLESTAELADENSRAVHVQGIYLKGASTN